MSRFTTQAFNASSLTGLVVGEPDHPSRCTWEQVHSDACRIAGGLAQLGVGPGSVVALLLGNPGDVARAVQAAWLRRASVTMIQPPTPRATAASWFLDTERTLRAIGADLLMLGEPYGDVSVDHPVATIDALREADPVLPLEAAETDPALLQLTSGSTGDPKAVVITHENLYAGTLAMRDGMQLRSTDRFVFWVPLYHDMGMIGMLLLPMQYGLETVAITPSEFIRDPLLWLELISRYGGTITAAPNFAFGLVARRLASVQDRQFNLTSLRFAAIGAEPIDPATIEAFVSGGARHGLNATAMVPAYGLAEATLAVTFAVGNGVVADDPILAPPTDTASERLPKRYVRLGFPLPGLEVRVTADGAPAQAREVGEVEIRGDAVTSGYLTGDGYLPAQDNAGWLATGDLGYVTEAGELVICGRRKDIIIISGRNFYPTDIERACERVDHVRYGNVVAVRLDAVGGEGFAVIAESSKASEATTNRAIRLSIATMLQQELGITPRSVLVVAPGTIPKTSSGKLRRAESQKLLSAPPELQRQSN